jgi:2-octaprenyl-6-methoxyphenol hydroxylase
LVSAKRPIGGFGTPRFWADLRPSGGTACVVADPEPGDGAAFGKRAGRFVKTAKRFAYPLALTVAHVQALPRAVILGNAAHSLHPVAGQGFNLCLRDCLALTQRLHAAHRAGTDLGDFSLLRDYEAAREEDQLNVIRFSDGIVRGFSNATPGLTLARNLGLVTFDLLPVAKQALARYAMGLGQ